MGNSSNVRNDVNRLAQQIESLAKQVQEKLAQGLDPIGVANELVRNSSTFIFALGEMYALEENSKKTVKVKPVSGSNVGSGTYYNVRDSLGRFVRA